MKIFKALSAIPFGVIIGIFFSIFSLFFFLYSMVADSWEENEWPWRLITRNRS